MQTEMREDRKQNLEEGGVVFVESTSQRGRSVLPTNEASNTSSMISTTTTDNNDGEGFKYPS